MSAYFQEPLPGTQLILFRGDARTFTLMLSHPEPGTAWLRTNIGHAEIARQAIIREAERDEPPLGQDWFDIPMIRTGDRAFQVTIPLCEVGHFEAKCYFLPQGKTDPKWPQGPNTIINVQPADTCCANIIYNAFVRQFGPNKSGGIKPNPAEDACVGALDKLGYTVIPKSGTFRDLIRELDFIINELGCRWIQLLPIHPTPTTYARMGRFGSPYATLSFTAVDPAQAEFDPKATPLEQFIELVDAVHERNAKLILDIAINHTGWAASLHETHPQWLVRGEDGRIEVPGAWGVKWEDLTKLDYRHKELWKYMADVFLTWCRRGVDGFRCDAGYMIPVAAWKYIVAAVREQYPDTVFFLEGLGGLISVTRDILNIANFNWAYSELFQNYDRDQIERYLSEAFEIAQTDGLLIHFAETHDNNRLASRSIIWAKMRTALCALFSRNGGFAFANGVEWLAVEKINVHEAPSLNWGASVHQIDHIQRLITLLKYHPAFHARVALKFIHQGTGNYAALLRHHLPTGKKLLVLVNLDDQQPVTAMWNPTEFTGTRFWDLLNDREISVTSKGEYLTCLLSPGQVRCLSHEAFEINHSVSGIVPRIEKQRFRAKAMDVFRFYHTQGDIGDFDPDQAAWNLAKNPIEYCRSLNPFSDESRVIVWQWQKDVNREVMVPPEHFLLLRCEHPFRARIIDGERTLAHEDSLKLEDGSHIALFSPLPVPKTLRSLTLKLSVYSPGKTQHRDAAVLWLCRSEHAYVQRSFDRPTLLRRPVLFLATNGRGGMLRAHALWGKLESRYDALLAANLNPNYPEDRHVMLTRCRGWMVFQGFSAEIHSNCLYKFYTNGIKGFWEYHIPSGQGEYVRLTVLMEMIAGENSVRIRFVRHHAEGRKQEIEMLADHQPVRLIVRPDIEDRNFHDVTKAYAGPESQWTQQIAAEPDGFRFTPALNRQLHLRMVPGVFKLEPEWYYMIHHPLDAERGLDPDSDLFSPGYFSVFLKGGEAAELTASVMTHSSGGIGEAIDDPWQMIKDTESPIDVLQTSLHQYIVRRESLNTVIAGYPWFLDWGRDTLIVVRGLIAAGKIEESHAILKQLARFEQYGTLPNMIRGNDASNRDTSDAPLWFFVACSDLIRAQHSNSFLDEDCSGRSLRDVLISIGKSLISGTPNGIRMDSESGLLFSPSHFTWMDTNHPAGSPREGYPIEIQALWQFALCFLAEIDPNAKSLWTERAQQVKNSIRERFYMETHGYLSDCLHAHPGISARYAEPDDALRPNQLFAITLGAVTDTVVCRNILSACEELLVPGAIRSLADRPVQRLLPIVHQGKQINNPHRPYQGRYIGDEDTHRKPAYHNGTAWTWVFPSFCEAWVKVYGDGSKETAKAWLSSSSRLLNQSCVGHIPEILDGDFPHQARGCDAQAWGASEWVRVWKSLVP